MDTWWLSLATREAEQRISPYFSSFSAVLDLLTTAIAVES